MYINFIRGLLITIGYFLIVMYGEDIQMSLLALMVYIYIVMHNVRGSKKCVQREQEKSSMAC